MRELVGVRGSREPRARTLTGAVHDRRATQAEQLSQAAAARPGRSSVTPLVCRHPLAVMHPKRKHAPTPAPVSTAGKQRAATTDDQALTTTLARAHQRFLRFLNAKVHDEELAEEILQAAYLKAAQKAGAVRDGESAVAWFFRLLRNAVVDHHRLGQRHERLRARYASERAVIVNPDELHAVACQCVSSLVPQLRPDYAQAIRRVDLDDVTVPQLATEQGITPNLAGVRLHRARRALRDKVQSVCGACATHGCRDCSCRSPS